MRIEVTQEDIRRGKPHLPGACALARSLRRHTGRRWQVAGGFAFVCGLPRNEADVELPVRAIRFTSRFDRGLPVQPFHFEFGWDQGRGTPGTGVA